jgi:hypothetical protein
MGSRYLFICLYVSLEKYFSRGDYNALPKAHLGRVGDYNCFSTQGAGRSFSDPDIPLNIALISISVLGVTVLGQNRNRRGTFRI